MNSFFKVKGCPFASNLDTEYFGVVIGNDEPDLMRKVMEAYNNPTQVTFWFGGNFDSDIVDFEDFKECPLFDFN